MGGVIVAMVIIDSWQKNRAPGANVRRGLVMFFCVIFGQLAVTQYAASEYHTGPRTDGDLVKRISLLLSFKLTSADSVASDGSVQERIDAQAAYWDLIGESPLFGHGLGAERYYMTNGTLSITARFAAWYSSGTEVLPRG